MTKFRVCLFAVLALASCVEAMNWVLEHQTNRPLLIGAFLVLVTLAFMVLEGPSTSRSRLR